MGPLLLALIFGSLYLLYYIINFYRNVAKYPSGPLPLPLFGNLFSISKETLDKDIARLAKKYGSVFTIFIPIPVVVLSDYKSVKDAFVAKADQFSARPKSMSNNEPTFCENPGVILSNGDSWRENRRQAISILRDFGMGKGLMEEKVKLSIEEYLRCLHKIENKEEVDMRWPIQLMVSNIINEILFGFRYKYDDCAYLIDYVETFNDLILSSSNSKLRILYMKYKWIKHVPILGYYAVHKHNAKMLKLHSYIRDNVQRSLMGYNKGDEPECYTQAYSNKIGTNPYITMEQLYATCHDFFLAGQETTTTTLRWAMLFLADNIDVQEKARAELRFVVGSSRLPSMSDKPNMPYMSALVLELQRKANIVQASVFHATSEDTEIMGHRIPKGTLIDGDIHHILSNDPLFENPEVFRPERFLSEDGKTLKKELVDHAIAFSIGKRQCAGEGLARVELFLGLAATIQHYRILPTELGPVNLEPIVTAIMMPPSVKVRLIPIAE